MQNITEMTNGMSNARDVLKFQRGFRAKHLQNIGLEICVVREIAISLIAIIIIIIQYGRYDKRRIIMYIYNT